MPCSIGVAWRPFYKVKPLCIGILNHCSSESQPNSKTQSSPYYCASKSSLQLSEKNHQRPAFVMSSQDVGRSPSFKSILLPAESRSQNTLPSPFSHTVASIRDGVGTQWIFYYNVQSIISYEKIPAHGKPTRSQLIIDGKPVVGGPNDSVAATSALDSVSRVLYIPLCCKIQKAKDVGSCLFFFFSFCLVPCKVLFSRKGV